MAGRQRLGRAGRERLLRRRALALDITIKENLVPLESDTVYSSKEIIVLDSQGDHQWQAQTTPPAINSVQGQCESADGQLCLLTGITVSTINAAVGYTWESYNSHVGSFTNGSVAGQLHQFANISVTQNPQSQYLYPGCGFSGTVRIAYDLLGEEGLELLPRPDQQQEPDPPGAAERQHGGLRRPVFEQGVGRVPVRLQRDAPAPGRQGDQRINSSGEQNRGRHPGRRSGGGRRCAGEPGVFGHGHSRRSDDGSDPGGADAGRNSS